MCRAVPLVAVFAAAAALAACGGTVPATGPEAEPPDVAAPATDIAILPPETGSFSETSEFAETGGGEPARTATPEPTPDPPIPELKPPPIVLESEAGRQEAVQGSYCITRVNASGEGEGICADMMFPHPDELSVVRPGDPITITFTGANIVVPAGCTPASSCRIVRVHPLGCGPDRVVAGFPTAWTVELEPGAYELSVFVYFDDGEGTSGDTSGALGLLVDPDREPAIIPVDESLAVCPYPEQP